MGLYFFKAYACKFGDQNMCVSKKKMYILTETSSTTELYSFLKILYQLKLYSAKEVNNHFIVLLTPLSMP